jgi:hypothetical protein
MNSHLMMSMPSNVPESIWKIASRYSRYVCFSVLSGFVESTIVSNTFDIIGRHPFSKFVLF